MSDDAGKKAAATYNAASDHFDKPALSFWDRFGRSTVERIGLHSGARVLDVCCGSGASALPAAERVAPAGHVLAVDLAERLVELGRTKARRRGLSNIDFRVEDMRSLGSARERFDAVICVFGIFFVPDMPAALRDLWRLVRPGGRLAITTWGRGVFEPANTLFWDAVRKERPDLHKAFNPWDRISEPAALAELFREADIEGVEILEEPAEHPLESPDDWWVIVMGSGYRATVEQLDAEARDRVRQATLEPLRRRAARSVAANVIYATATRPPDLA